MSLKSITKAFQLKDGREIIIETGKLARQADGAVVVRMGNCMILATVVAANEAREGVDFMPLTVDYQEKYAAAGRFPGGFFKREARLSEYEILISRLIDRALRPLFPEDFHADIQVMVTLISADKNIAPDSLAGLAASAALALTDIPFNGPMSEVRVARIDGQLVINPYLEDLKKADIDLIVAGTADNIVMVEGESKEVSENDMLEAIKFAHEAIKDQCRWQIEMAVLAGGIKPKRTYSHETNDSELKEAVWKACYDKAYQVAMQGNPNKHERKAAFNEILESFIQTVPAEELEEKTPLIKRYYADVEYHAVRNVILDHNRRLDGRGLTEIRPISAEINLLPSTHGSSLFTRGETQSLTTVTLGTKLDEQIIDGAMFEGHNKFLLHYNFPGFSTGEVRPNRGPGRREIGHGNLAMRSLRMVFPDETNNPYTVRVVSDILESNGSSSMATVCAGSMALMDAGIKMKSAVSGIAMGLISDGQEKFVVLSDILGDEDHLGDMDFKVTGTRKGICACQMDLKVQGLPFDIMLQALNQARDGRLHILGEMDKAISQPADDYKPHAPRIEIIHIPKDFIGAVIGKGGEVIQEMQRETGTVITIEEVADEGIIEIASSDKASIEKAKARIAVITAVPTVGEVYNGVVKSIQTFGAFIEIIPGKEGLLHISEISWDRVAKVEDVLKPGDPIEVKLLEVDQKTGKMKLSHKVLTERPKREPSRKPVKDVKE
ncbi:MAG: polyribonucleotide nucleotidyltransferase [Bacteroidia bacterium]|nr:polyribonucleotide nucleotidyltransferase [Bacteroidia bacterium]MCZ2278058.1 polyribonucleotide nucleotidyltransferase [Bacteroidia bacterium]